MKPIEARAAALTAAMIVALTSLSGYHSHATQPQEPPEGHAIVELSVAPGGKVAVAGKKVTLKQVGQEIRKNGKVDPEAFQSVALETVPEEMRTPGTFLLTQAADGSQRPVRVHEVNEDAVVLDFNHPLAGKNLSFDIRILSIQ